LFQSLFFRVQPKLFSDENSRIYTQLTPNPKIIVMLAQIGLFLVRAIAFSVTLPNKRCLATRSVAATHFKYISSIYSVRASSLASILKPSSELPVAAIALNLV
jgi:hypothetical protein